MREHVVLLEAIYKTIDDIELWQDVLRLLSEFTGAKKGIITLRNRTTAELVIPTDVKFDLSSPLLYGFSEAEVGSYITHYIQHDPWTEFEKLFHPIPPYALSKFVNKRSLRESLFWEWLEPQAIDDCVVLNIGASSSGWVAMNLYYSTEDKGVKQKILETTGKLQNIMQNVWRYGQRFRASQMEPAYLEYFLEQQAHASLLLSSKGKVMLMNEKANKLFSSEGSEFFESKGLLRIKDKGLDAKFNSAMRSLKKRSVMAGGSSELTFCGADMSCSLALIGKPEDQLGSDTGMRLLVIKKKNQSNLVWENPALTKTERQLVELIANGGRIVDYIQKYSRTKSTAHFHWGNVKKKLGVKSISEIYASHQVYLQNL